MATDLAGRPCRPPARGRKARPWAARSPHHPPGRSRPGQRARTRASFPAVEVRAARRRSMGSLAPSSAAPGGRAARNQAHGTTADRTVVSAGQPCPGMVRRALGSPGWRRPVPVTQAADLSPDSRSPRRSAQGLSFPRLSFPDSSSPGSFQGRRRPFSRGRVRRDRVSQVQGRSMAARMASAFPALVRLRCRAVPAVPVRRGFTGRESRSACRPATRASRRVSFRPVSFQPVRCRAARGREGRSRPGCPRRGSSRPATQARADRCLSVSSRADQVRLPPGRCRRASSCPAPACPMADQRPRDNSVRRGRSLDPVRSLRPVRSFSRDSSASRDSSFSLVSSARASRRASRCRAPSSARPSTPRPVHTDRPVTSERPAGLRLIGPVQGRSRPEGSRPDRQGRLTSSTPTGSGSSLRRPFTHRAVLSSRRRAAKALHREGLPLPAGRLAAAQDTVRRRTVTLQARRRTLTRPRARSEARDTFPPMVHSRVREAPRPVAVSPARAGSPAREASPDLADQVPAVPGREHLGRAPAPGLPRGTAVLTGTSRPPVSRSALTDRAAATASSATPGAAACPASSAILAREPRAGLRRHPGTPPPAGPMGRAVTACKGSRVLMAPRVSRALTVFRVSRVRTACKGRQARLTRRDNHVRLTFKGCLVSSAGQVSRAHTACQGILASTTRRVSRVRTACKGNQVSSACPGSLARTTRRVSQVRTACRVSQAPTACKGSPVSSACQARPPRMTRSGSQGPTESRASLGPASAEARRRPPATHRRAGSPARSATRDRAALPAPPALAARRAGMATTGPGGLAGSLRADRGRADTATMVTRHPTGTPRPSTAVSTRT